MKTTSIRKGDVIILPCNACVNHNIWGWGSNEPYKILDSGLLMRASLVSMKYPIEGTKSGEKRMLRYEILPNNEISPCSHGVHIKKLNKSEQDLYKISL